MPESPDYRQLTQHPMLSMPEPVGTIILVSVSALVAALFLWALYRCRADRGTFLLVLVAALASCGMEAWAEFMAMNYHPQIGGHIAYEAWGMPVPIHIALSYVLYFGGPGYYLLHVIQQGRSLAGWWLIFAVNCLGVTAADLVALNLGAWIYYGHQPLVMFKLPVTWMFCNTAAIFSFSTVVHVCLSHLAGARRLLTILLVPIGLAMTWAAVCLPLGNALHSDQGPLSSSLAAFISIGVSLLFCHLSIGYFRSVANITIVPIGKIFITPEARSPNG